MAASTTRREVLTAVGASAVAGALASSMTTVALASAQTGTTAPAFTATDSKGRQHSLAAYKGQTIQLYFEGIEGSTTATSFLVDDVSIK